MLKHTVAEGNIIRLLSRLSLYFTAKAINLYSVDATTHVFYPKIRINY
jgi:hypothetical protein